ncbi:IS110 family transposase [Streptomyces sp. JHA26]|uniref:IS110 family transposase n=1 Tax=Streptomyces sp. JHA26 TaxID=1917143 RepID=UPI00209A9268|nr:IS110 family transposase [Streptomyces sp. JHA26]
MPQAGRDGAESGDRVVNEDKTVDVYLGLDVGKGEHHATALTPAGKKAFDKPLPNTEPKLRELFAKLQAKHGTVLVVVDQPASVGALPLAVARDMGCQVAYLPGLTMRRIADLYPGEAKTDARDAYVIADAARTMPHTLRAVDPTEETTAELQMVVGFDDDLTAETTRLKNRLRGLLTQIHPSLEHVLGPHLDHPAVLALLERFGSPAQIRKAGRRRLVALLRPKAPRTAERLVDDIFTALDEQTVVVPGTEAATLIVPSLASSLSSVLGQRKALATRIEELLEAHPLSQVLTSMPGIGVRTAARILIDVGDGTVFPTAGHLAAYAGLAPVTRASGSSIRGEHPARRGNRQLKRALYLAAFASLKQPESRAYYDKKRREGKHHVAAVIALARRRVDVLFAMLRDGTFYQAPVVTSA